MTISVTNQNESTPLLSKTAVMTKTDWAIHGINQMEHAIKSVSEWKLWAVTIGLVMRILWILPAVSVWIASRINSHTIELNDTYWTQRVVTWGGWGPTIEFHANYKIIPGEDAPTAVTRTERKYTEWTDRMLGDEAYYKGNYW